MAVQHLLALGRTRIFHISGPTGNLEAEVRRAGYAEALGEAGLHPQVLDGDFTQAAGYRAVMRMLDGGERPDAIFAGNDMMAVGALLALQEAGVACPEDVAVVGFDDVADAADYRPPLTTLRQDFDGLGRAAIASLVARIEGGAVAPVLLSPELVIRASA